MDDLSKLLRETFEYNMTDVHTALSGVIKKYDPSTRRADVQPSLKRKIPGGKYLDFPVIPDVPVLFPGTKKYVIHFSLEEGDEVLLIASERGTDLWKARGGKGIEEADPRRFDLQDCYAIPGLQAVDFIPAEEDGLNIVHRSSPKGETISQVTMNDEKVEAKYKKVIVCLKGDKASVKNGSKSLFTIWDTLLQKLQQTTPTTLGSPAQHNWNPAISTALATAKTDLGILLEA
jgi:hypothetical protein